MKIVSVVSSSLVSGTCEFASIVAERLSIGGNCVTDALDVLCGGRVAVMRVISPIPSSVATTETK